MLRFYGVNSAFADIGQYHRILDLRVICEEDDLGYDLGGLGVVINKRQEYLSPVLRMYGKNGDHSTSKLMNDSASEVHRIIRKIAVDQRV